MTLFSEPDMKTERIRIAHIPALVWGVPSDKVFLCVHGKLSSKDAFAELAAIAETKGYQTVSFDLPQHGERTGESLRCDIWNGIRELTAVADYVFSRWKEVNLYACSLGAYFSLQAYPNHPFHKCLFQSPILDMEYLVRQMMLWFDVTEERLEWEKEIDTPIDPLRWDYFQYILANPIVQWHIPTYILYGGNDNLQSREIMDRFTDRFGCSLRVSPHSEHSFMEPQDGAVVEQWLRDTL